MKHSFLAIKGYWIDQNWNYHEELLDFPVIEGKHSGENLGRLMQATIDEYSLSEQLVSITTDNASNNDTLCAAVYVLSNVFIDRLY